MSSLARMAVDEHKHLKVTAGDMVIVSASAIPGNEDSVWRTVNHLFQRGANVIYDTIAPVHVSGHGYAEELKLMLNLVNPRFVIPVHGEYRMLARYAAIAEQMGWPKEDIVRCEIGDIIEVDENKAARVGRVEQSGAVLIDGAGVGDVSEVVLRDRQHLSSDGFLVIVIGLDKENGELVTGPEVISRGFVFMDESDYLVEEIKQSCIEHLDTHPVGIEHDWGTVSHDLRLTIGKMLYKKTQRRPMILPIIMEV
jgi:ribonuclease J